MQKITEIKLQEIEKKRTRILQKYEDIEKSVSRTKKIEEQLEVLSKGLNEVEKNLDMKSVETILTQAKYNTISNEILVLTYQKLFKKIAYGRTKAEFAYIFGNVLKEVFSSNKAQGDEILEDVQREEIEFEESEQDKNSEEKKKAFEVAKSLLEGFDKKKYDKSFLSGLFNQMSAKIPEIKSSLSNYESGIKSKVSIQEIQSAIKALCLDNLITSKTKKYLTKIESDTVICNEFAGAVTIMIENIEEWDWPEVNNFRLIKNLTEKWRMFIEEDIVNAIFLQVVGTRWGYTLKTCLESIFSRERYCYNSDSRMEIVKETILSTLPNNLTDSTPSGNYDSPGSQCSKKELIIHHIAAETMSGRSHLKRLVNIVSTDIENFYASISQEMIIDLLGLYGLSQKWIEFFTRFMRPMIVIDYNGTKVEGKIKRGLLSGHSISKFLHEILMFLGDFHYGFSQKKYIVRDFDDIFYLGQSDDDSKEFFQKIEEFTLKSGLKLSKEKTGQITLNCGRNRVTNNPITYGLLTMDKDGNWLPNLNKVEKMNKSLESHLKSCTTILQSIRVYNSHLRQLEKLLSSPSPAMGVKHLDALIQIFSNLHLKVFNGKGIIGYLEQQIELKFKERNKNLKIPEAWYYWPLTAGGMGVHHPLITLSAYGLIVNQDKEQSLFKSVKMEDDLDSGESSRQSPIVEHIITSLAGIKEPPSPNSSTVLDGRIRDFIARGSDLRGAKQTVLGVYWTWMVCNYADQILETVGTLEFTDTELVPIALIQSK